jgi:hypothetical protein
MFFLKILLFYDALGLFFDENRYGGLCCGEL